MIKIRISDEERQLETADAQWINQQINRRRADGQLVCVRVIIHVDGLDMALSTPNCGTGGSGGRPPTVQEKSVFDLWDKRGLNDADFNGGNLIAFLNQLR